MRLVNTLSLFGRRCPLHSLDSHKYRSSGIWIDVWISLSQQCREEVS